ENVDRDMVAQPPGIAEIYDRPLPCFGCGIGWFSFALGFVFPPFWYYATILYFRDYHLKDPRERAGLAASAIAVSRYLSLSLFSFVLGVLIYSIGVLISLLAILWRIAREQTSLH
ncbi:hypothetical protein RJ641_020484, partial [Dillenia turbinata]